MQRYAYALFEVEIITILNVFKDFLAQFLVFPNYEKVHGPHFKVSQQCGIKDIALMRGDIFYAIPKTRN